MYLTFRVIRWVEIHRTLVGIPSMTYVKTDHPTEHDESDEIEKTKQGKDKEKK